jgi:7-carboxy-7-deazaguanine synthase
MKVNEIFQSISGEVGAIPQGAITWFIRFQGCSLSCTWCDTKQAIDKKIEGGLQSPLQIAQQIPAKSNVILTGGEPLAQNHDELKTLVSLLKERYCLIQAETNGSHPPFLPIYHVFDYKTPSSGMQDKMMPLYHFLEFTGVDQIWIKFVIKNRHDLEFTLDILTDFYLLYLEWHGLQIALSIENGECVSYVISRLKETMPSLMHRIVFNFQLHKHFNLK